MSKFIKIISNIVFVLVLALSGLFFLAHFTKILPLRIFIVSSGSMEPAIKTGSLVFVVPAKVYGLGDIVTFKTSPKTTTTHRLVAIGDGEYKTAGDANDQPDSALISSNQILGKVFYTAPYLGYIAAFAKTPPGFILFVIVPATIIVYEELKALFLQIKRKGVGGEVHIKPVFIILPVFFAAFILITVKSISYFSDTETSSSNSFTAFVTTPTPTPTPQLANHVIISEVQLSASGAGNTDNDFVEFYNPASSPFNLNGHRLVKRTGSSSSDTTLKSWTSTAIIPAHGFYLWANSSIAASISADASTTGIISASNSIALRLGLEDVGTIIDALSWNSSVNSLKEGTEFSPDPGDNQSMERKALSTSTAATMEGGVDASKGNGYDADNNSTDFIMRTLSQPPNSTSSTETP